MNTMKLIDSYLRAIERGDEAALLDILHPDVVQQEHPNALNKAGRVYDRAQMLAALKRGKMVTRDEKYVVTNSVVDEERGRAAVELEWSATLAIDAGERKAGSVMQARFGSFFETQEGRIVRQSHYDCFLP